ncbi:MarR family winged helix-turn-helix transcriptional regulator [Deinococcus sp. QL22]|uniref:MarR family winged helix-turn-helix transcriptional regulator n=1 Tax=Deinococcus sp. QL22 TaxID=2939437 RepID=UPI002017ADFB|nr:MarR family winged helix-turn-helix transcriptional regulator [Deinococcus sp. QL22]UQN10307.1 hypothetical protein M1R55_29590 [Deinococcus sp. QL22]UQN10441.1 hypothetical protein M1R55_28915 [Deinococcus sp. QL22]
MSNTTLLTLSARIAELERTARSGHEAQETLTQLYQKQNQVAAAIEATQDIIYAGEDAEATLKRLSAVLNGGTPAEAQSAATPAVAEVAVQEADAQSPLVEPDSTPGLQVGKVLVVGSEAAGPPEGTPQEPAPAVPARKPPEMTQAERQTTLLADLAAHPDSSNREVKNRLGWSDSTTAKWITRLTTQGYLTVDSTDWPYRYRLSEQTQCDFGVLVEAEVLPPVVAEVESAPVETEAQAEAEQSEAEPTSEPAPQPSSLQTQLVAWVSEHGPHRAKDVAAAFNLYPGPCAVQLNALVREGLLMTFPGTSPVIYALPGTPLPVPPIEAQAPKTPEPAARSVPLPSDRTHRALLLLDLHGPQSHRGLHGYMDVDFSITTLQRLLTALEEEGLVEMTPSQTVTTVSLTPLGRARLAAYASGEIKPALPPKPGKKAQVVEQVTSFRSTPSQEDLNITMRANAALVLGVLEAGQAYVETDLVKATGLALSHLRMALGNLQATGEVQRLDGVGTRAMYRLEQLDLPEPEGDTLTPEGERVAAHLAHVTARSASDTATNIATGLRLPRVEVDQALAVLNAQGRLAYTRIANLVTYTLRNAAAEAAA